MNDDVVLPHELTTVFLLGGVSRALTTRLADSMEFEHISIGDLLRAEVASESNIGKQIAAAVESGDLVDVSPRRTLLPLLHQLLSHSFLPSLQSTVILALVKKAMKRSGSTKFLIVGYPKALDQAFAFEQSVGAPTRVISVEGSEEALKKSWTAQGASEAAVQKQAEIYREHTQAVSPCRGRVTNKCAPYAILVLCPGPRQVVDFYSKVGCARRVNYEASEDALYAKLKDLFLPETVFVLGGPGAGKTSQCKQLAEDLGYIHLSTGDLLRAEVAAGTSLGRQVQATLRRGDLVPNDTIMQLLKNAISKRPLGRFLLDGYPRTADQAREFTQAVGPATCVLHFSAPDDTLRRRVLRRGQTSGRRDDNVEAFNRQLRVYKNATAGVLTLYRQSGLVREIDASGSVAWVSKLAHAALRPRVVFVLGGPGVGKGTQCARIARDYGYVHLSAGDLLRAEIARVSSGSVLGFIHTRSLTILLFYSYCYYYCCCVAGFAGGQRNQCCN